MEFEDCITRKGPYKSFKNATHFLTLRNQVLYGSGSQPRFPFHLAMLPMHLQGWPHYFVDWMKPYYVWQLKENEQSAQ